MVIAVPLVPDANHVQVEAFQGFTIKEDASAVATLEFRLVIAGGVVVWYLNMLADETVSIMFPEPILSTGGIYVNEATGSVTGTLFSKF